MPDRPQIGSSQTLARSRFRQPDMRRDFTAASRPSRQFTPFQQFDEPSPKVEVAEPQKSDDYFKPHKSTPFVSNISSPELRQTNKSPEPRHLISDEFTALPIKKIEHEKQHAYLVPSKAKAMAQSILTESLPRPVPLEQANVPQEIVPVQSEEFLREQIQRVEEQPVRQEEAREQVYESAEPIEKQQNFEQQFVKEPQEQPASRSFKQKFSSVALKKLPASRLSTSLLAGAFIVLTIGAVIAFQSVSGNHGNSAAIAGLVGQNGTTGSSSPPSIIKPSASDIGNYTVGLNQPRYLDIPGLNIHSRVMPLAGTLSSISDFPSNIYDLGWYDQSSLPGEPGAMILTGHTRYNGNDGALAGISKLKAGSQIHLNRGDDVIFTYKVIKTLVYPDGNVDLQSALRPIDPTAQSLNIITAPGEGVPGYSGSKVRMVVYTIQL